MSQKKTPSDYEMVNGFSPPKSQSQSEKRTSPQKSGSREDSRDHSQERWHVDYDKEPLVTKHVGNDKDPEMNAKFQNRGRGGYMSKPVVRDVSFTPSKDEDGFAESEVDPPVQRKVTKKFRDYLCCISIVFGVALVVFLAFLIGLVIREDYRKKRYE